MKKKLLWIIVYSFSIASCTTDTATQNSDSKIRNVNNEFIHQSSTNIYKAQEEQYNEIINSYIVMYGFPETVEELTLHIQAIEVIINKQKVNNNISATNRVVSDILKNPKGKLQQMIQVQNISFAAQDSLLELINILMETSAYEQTILNDSITAYKMKVIQNETLDKEEKQVVLSFVSISQFLVSTETVRKDRDWEKAVTNKRIQNSIDERQVSIVTLVVLINNLISSH